MNIQPVTKYKMPKYPQKIEVMKNPTILNYVPSRWKKNAIVMTAFSLTLTLSACSAHSSANLGVSPGSDAPSLTPTASVPLENTMVYTAAPIFEHGSGSGSYGCSSITAPYFFSEEEALEIIRAEAESYGNITFLSSNPISLEQVEIPITDLYDELSYIITKGLSISRQPLCKYYLSFSYRTKQFHLFLYSSFDCFCSRC